MRLAGTIMHSAATVLQWHFVFALRSGLWMALVMTAITAWLWFVLWLKAERR